ncbi:hypothetical protein [Vagococcus salmoninarum]|uniref:hypothetical protein n=1 Tax=Vagococcus salmoninarum TaxID=2739 RepID=UPI00187F8AC7|nr:hypothetical protein [Vagococcus salmoninarum]MBE9387848.1 hypothetical protein [Vagococcus salmoninarum]
MKVTMDMQEYETLRDTQIPYKVEETDSQKIVRVSKNVIEQTLAEKLDTNDITKDSGSGYMTTKKAKEFVVVFDD